VEIEIRNFQSHSHSVLDVKGLVFVVGLNSVGKSSIRRAVQFALDNESGDDFIKDGTSEVSVSLKVGDIELTWGKKKKEGGEYSISGQNYKKLGRGSFDLIADMGLGSLQTNTAEANPNIWGEWDAPFLINIPNTQKFEFLSRVMPERDLIPVLKKVNSDLQEKRGELTRKQAVVEDLEVRIQQRKDLVERLMPIEALTGRVSSVTQRVDLLRRLFDLAKGYLRIVAQKQPLTRELERVAIVVTSGKTENVAEIEAKLVNLVNLENEKVKIENVISKVEHIVSVREGVEREVSVLTGMEGTIGPDYLERIEGKLVLLDKTEQLGIHAVNVQKELSVFRTEMDKISADLNESTAELSEFKTCPLCGQEICND